LSLYHIKNCIPEAAIDTINSWIGLYSISLRIAKKRRTKLGDYRAPIGKHGHRISVNGNLNQYAFLVTLVHEIAHLITWEKYRRKAKPHGTEWKQEYKTLMNQLDGLRIFPSDVKRAVGNYMENPNASSCTDIELSKVLAKYNTYNFCYLEDLQEMAVFQIENGRQFQKGPLRRTRYKCKDLNNNKYYLFSPITEVIPAKSAVGEFSVC